MNGPLAGRAKRMGKNNKNNKNNKATLDLSEVLSAIDRTALEMITSGLPLPGVLDGLTRTIEARCPGQLCSILLLDPSRKTLRHAAAPSLPDSYTQAIDGASIGSCAGSCGTAAYRGEPVIVEDIASDPLWSDYRELALRHGLRACWSTPIICKEGQVQGTFAAYYREPRSPSPRDLQVIERATHLAAIAIERQRAETERQVISEIIQGVNVSANLDECLQLIHRSLKKALYAENYFVALYDRKSGMFNFPFFVDQFDAAPPRENLERSCTAYIFRTGRPMLIPQDVFEQLAEEDEVDLVGTPSPAWLGVPLKTPKETIGVLVLQHYEDRNAYTARDLEFLASVGAEIATAIDRRRAEEEVRAAEMKLRTLVEQLPAITYIAELGAAGRWTTVYISPQVQSSLGVSPREWMADPESWVKRLHPEDRDRVLGEEERTQRKGEPFHSEYRMVTHEGRVQWFHDEATVIRGPDGQPSGLLGVVHDITERKRLEQTLRMTQFSVDSASDAIFWLRSDSSFAYVNDAACQLLGYSRAELLALNASGVNPVHSQTAWPTYWAELQQRRKLTFEATLRAKDGRSIPVEISANYMTFEGQEQNCSFVRDFSERKRAEEEIRNSAARITSILESITDAFFTLDKDWRFAYVNQQAEHLLQRSGKELLGKNIWQEFSPAVGSTFDQEYHRAAEQRSAVHFEEFYEPLATWFEVHAYPSSEGLSVYFRDISERKRVEEHLRLQSAALESAANSMVLTDREGAILWVNPAFTRLTGYTAQEALGRNPRILKSGVHPKSFYEEMWNTILGGRVWHGEVINQRKDGCRFTVESTITPVLNEGGEVNHFLNISQDVTERKLAEATVDRLKRQNELILNSVGEGIFGLDLQGRTMFVNAAAARMMGCTAEELIGRPMHESLHHSKPDGTPYPVEDCPVHATLRDGASHHVDNEVFWKKDGPNFPVEYTSTPIRDERDELLGAVVVFEDVAKQRLLETQLRQAQKMEAVGQLAGGVAHDFNNLIGVILGYSEIILDRPDADEKLLKQAEQIQKAGRSAASLTRQLLAFSRKQVLEPRVVDVNAILGDISKMLQRLIGEDIRLVTVAGSKLGQVKVDPGQMEQVVLNLAVNARDAMPRGGVLTIETANVVLDEEYVRQHPVSVAGRYVMLGVSDTGVGMNAETQSHIFEPFFTTKEQGKGTGLGLATVYGIVKQSGGYIWVYSEVGVGTTFKIYLPQVEEKSEPAQLKGKEKVTRLLQGTETIVLVEDAEGLREFVRESLESRGYTVLTATSAQEAIRLVEQSPEAIHLLLTDVVMPGMDGRALAEHLRPLRPGMRVLYMSGYTDDALGQHGMLAPGIALLQKPFTVQALSSKVRDVLDAA